MTSDGRALNLLIVLSETGHEHFGLLTALHGHCSLFCRTVTEARRVFEGFSPEIVLIDCQSLHSASPGAKSLLFGFCSCAFPKPIASNPMRSVVLPASAEEIEEFFLEILKDSRTRSTADACNF